jgi:hypothetical protein
MTDTRSKFKKDYARILQFGPTSESDYQLARELIDAGHAEGKYRVSNGRDDFGKVMGVLGFQINTSGRLFLDDLNSAITKDSWGHKAKVLVLLIVGGVGSLAIALVSGLGVEFLKNHLPK